MSDIAMSPDLLFHHFHRLTEAPDAIPRLRRFILDLAVRGRLVEQDPRDEPALELLNRIETEKLKLIEEGKLKRQEPLSSVDEDELPFPVPHGWQSTRLAVVAVCLDYMRKPINVTERNQRIARKNPSELFPYFGATQQQGWINDYIFDEELVLLGEDGVPFFDDLRPKAYLISGKTWVNNHAHVFRGILLSHAFLAYCLNTFDYKGRVAGATRSKLNQAKAVDIPIILPPLAEQHRIVAKVDELIALCDRLEAAQVARESRRDRLAASSLHRLNNGTDPDSFRNHARFYFNQLPRLTTKLEHIQQLRQTILDLAVRGKLIPPDPNDEPAYELLRRIQAEKARLAREGKINYEKQANPARADDLGFELKSGWQVARMSEILVELQTGPFGSSLHQSDYQKGGIPVINPASIKDERLVPMDGMAVGSSTLKRLATFKLRTGDIVMGRRGEMGRCAVVTEKEHGWLCGTGSLILRMPKCIFPRFLVTLIGSPFVREYLGGLAVGATMQNLNQSILLNLVIGLPPLAEQHRIVAKVDELMALCDWLEVQLTTTQTESRRFLEAVLHEALAPVP